MLTKGLHCLLLGFNKDKQKAELISKGFLRDRNCIDIDPPYSVFLGCGGKCICMMIHQNLMKVIPIVRSPKTKIALSQAFNIRIRHPEVNMIVPLHTNVDEQEDANGAPLSQETTQNIGILVLEKKVRAKGRRADDSAQLQLLRYKLDLIE